MRIVVVVVAVSRVSESFFSLGHTHSKIRHPPFSVAAIVRIRVRCIKTHARSVIGVCPIERGSTPRLLCHTVLVGIGVGVVRVLLLLTSLRVRHIRLGHLPACVPPLRISHWIAAIVKCRSWGLLTVWNDIPLGDDHSRRGGLVMLRVTGGNRWRR